MSERGLNQRPILAACVAALLLLLLVGCDALGPDVAERGDASEAVGAGAQEPGDRPEPVVTRVEEEVGSAALAAADQSRDEGARLADAKGTFSGHELYERNCSVCHGGDGGGRLGPALSGNRNLASSFYVVARIQLGGGGMPPFARLLTSEEIATAASYIRTTWGNGYGPVSEEQVDLQWHGLRRGLRYGAAVPTDY